MIARIRRGNDFKHVWAISWNGQPEDFSDATDITLTTTVYGQVKTLTEGVDYHIDGATVVVDFTPAICDITGTYNLELNYVKPNNTFIDGDKRSAVDINAFQIVASSDDADTTGDTSSTSDAAIGLQGKSAYQLWLDDGNVGTIEDYFTWLREPSVTAGAYATTQGDYALEQGDYAKAQGDFVAGLQVLNAVIYSATEYNEI